MSVTPLGRFVVLGVGLILALSLALAVGVTLFLQSYLRQPPRDRLVPSPDGRRVVRATINQDKANPRQYLCVRIRIEDAAGRVEMDEQTGASHVMRWSVGWSGNDRVILRSSDIGPLGWRLGPDGTWKPLPPNDPAIVEAGRTGPKDD